MATAGYLISRAAERAGDPVARGDDRRGAVLRARPAGRALPRAARLARPRAARARPACGRGSTSGSSRSRRRSSTAYRDGDLLSRMVADVDALQNLYLRGLGPPLVALLAGAVSVGVAAAFLPAAGLVLAAGLLVGGVAVPRSRPRGSGAAGRRQAARARRADGRADRADSRRAGARRVRLRARGARPGPRTRIARSSRSARRDALAAGAGDGVGAAGDRADRRRRARGRRRGVRRRPARPRADRAARRCWRWRRSRPSTPLGQAARELSATLAAGRRVLELDRAESAVARSGRDPAPAPRWPFAVALEHVRARYPGQPRPALDGVSLRLEPGERVALVGRAAPARRPSPTCCSASSIPRRPGDARRARSARVPPGGRPAGDRGRRPGLASVLGQHPRQRPPRAAGGERRGDRAGAAPRPDLGLDRSASGRARHARRRGGARALGRPAPADRAGPRAARRTRRCWCSTSRPPISTRRRPAS